MWDQHDGETVFRSLPYYKSIVKTFLQKQIQYLLEQMANEIGEESVIMTVNLQDGAMSHLGSRTGKAFLDGRDDLKTQFLTYCIAKTNPSLSLDQNFFNDQYPGINKRRYQASPDVTGDFHPHAKRRKKTAVHISATPGRPVSPNNSYDLKDNPDNDTDVKTSHSEGDRFTVGESGLDDSHKSSQDGPISDIDNSQLKGSSNSQNLSKNSNGKNSANDCQRDINHEGSQEYNQFLKDSLYPYTLLNKQTDNQTRDGAVHRDQLEDNPEAAESRRVLVEEMSGNIIKIEPLSEEEAPTGTSNKYLSTEGVVCLNKKGIVLRPKKLVRKEMTRRALLTLAEKCHILEDMEANPHLSHRQLAKRNNVGRSTIGLIHKNRLFYKMQYDVLSESPRKRFTQHTKYNAINDLVWKWYFEAKSCGLVVSGTMVREKALEIAKGLSETEFKASNGWLASWQKRYNVKTFRVTGETKTNAIAVTDANVSSIMDSKTPAVAEDAGVPTPSSENETASYDADAINVQDFYRYFENEDFTNEGDDVDRKETEETESDEQKFVDDNGSGNSEVPIKNEQV